ncbi:Fork head protein-like protein 2 [Psilocybe cubensis]|uniref:Fork head protein-like protein 2 n=2 Tax=Psilocybe cubensis TaxID=181762 RepID=A0ACB8H0E2_PSICU|nr:Fork head protein-like protein 2 [Psilocybe cubensis]KAH9480956.1 Fork head protein-like protein 2 [Psilocybe cubensis]
MYSSSNLYSSAHQSLTPKIIHSPETESISDTEELKEMEQYVNYGEDSGVDIASHTTNTENTTPVGAPLPQYAWQRYPVINFAPLYVYGAHPYFYTTMARPLPPALPSLYSWAPQIDLGTASTTNDTASSSSESNSLVESNELSKASSRKRGTSARVHKACKPSAKRVVVSPGRRVARSQRTSGELTPAEVKSLASAEVTERVVRSILGIADDVELKDAWPQGPDPWSDYSRPEVIMLAICCTKGHRATLSQIESLVMKKYPTLKTTNSGKGWRGTIRHNLSAHPQFRRLRREQGRGGPWTLDVTKIK